MLQVRRRIASLTLNGKISRIIIMSLYSTNDINSSCIYCQTVGREMRSSGGLWSNGGNEASLSGGRTWSSNGRVQWWKFSTTLTSNPNYY